MAGHEIGHQILIHAVLLVQGVVFFNEPVVNRIFRLAHPAEDGIGNMLRRHLQLPGDVVLHQFLEEGVLFVCQQIVEADAAADEDLLHPGDFPQLPQQSHIVAVVGIHILAGGGVQALPSAAGALAQLLLAGRVAEVGGGAAYIVDVALEILILHHQLCFLQNGFVASGLDDPPLMEGQGAEGAGAEAAPVGHQTEFDLLDGRHATGFFVAGVVGAAVGKLVDGIHLLGAQGLLGRILHHIFLAVGLRQPLGGEGVAVGVLDFEGLGIELFVGLHFLKGRQHKGGQAVVQLLCPEHSSIHKGDVSGFQPGVQGIRQLHDAPLAHAIHENVRLRIQQNGALHGVRPVVVVPQPPQAGLNAADEDGHIGVGLADQVAVAHRGVVRALAHDAAGGEGIGFPSALGDGVVIYHGVHIAAADQKAQPGTAVDVDGLGILPVRLGDDAHAVAVAFQHPADDGVTEGGVIHIGIPDDIHKVALLPAPVQHILSADGEKIHILPPKSVIFSIIPEMRGKGKKKIPDLPIRDRALLALNLLLGAVRLENIGVVQLTYQIGLDAVDVDPPQRGTLSGFFLRQLPFLGNVGQLVDSCNNFIHFHRKPHT